MKKIVVLGAGYAGLKTVIDLQKKFRDQAKIVLINNVSYHYETMRLYEVASGSYPYTKMSFELSDVIRPSMTSLIVDTVERVDYEKKLVYLSNHEPVSYDYCVIGLGFTLGTRGIEGADEYSLPMHDVKSAEAIRDRIYEQMQAYRRDKDDKHLQIVICGAGFQAVELAGAIAESRPRYAKMAGVTPDQIKITMLDGSPRVLPMFNDKLLAYALDVMKKRDINLINPAYVQKVTADSVSYKMAKAPEDAEPTVINAGTIIWMMAFSGHPITEKSGFKQNRYRVMVSEHLTAPESDDVYILGEDAAVMVPGKKWPYPPTAQMSLTMGTYAAEDLAARIGGKTRPAAYTYKSLGEVCSIGENQAVGMAMGKPYKGYLASALKKIIIDKSLVEIGGVKQMFAVGRFDLYH